MGPSPPLLPPPLLPKHPASCFPLFYSGQIKFNIKATNICYVPVKIYHPKWACIAKQIFLAAIFYHHAHSKIQIFLLVYNQKEAITHERNRELHSPPAFLFPLFSSA